MSEKKALVKKSPSKSIKTKKLKEKAKVDKPDVRDSEMETIASSISPNTSKRAVFRNRGVVYIGHIPHGFYEEQMRTYFKQFGKVTNVVVCRSKVSNRSKGFGFVQFEDPDVAKIAAETMDNYLMFKRKMIAKYIPPKQVKPHMLRPSFWISTSFKKFKTSREQQLRKKNTNIKDEDQEKYQKKAIEKLNRKKEQLAALGIKYDFAPVNSTIKSAKKIEPRKEVKLQESSSKVKLNVKKVKKNKS